VGNQPRAAILDREPSCSRGGRRFRLHLPPQRLLGLRACQPLFRPRLARRAEHPLHLLASHPPLAVPVPVLGEQRAAAVRASSHPGIVAHLRLRREPNPLRLPQAAKNAFRFPAIESARGHGRPPQVPAPRPRSPHADTGDSAQGSRSGSALFAIAHRPMTSEPRAGLLPRQRSSASRSCGGHSLPAARARRPAGDRL
jgi:hypothetical protein